MLYDRVEASAISDAIFRTHLGLIPDKSWQVWYYECKKTLMSLAGTLTLLE